jgi:hypothetical protein
VRNLSPIINVFKIWKIIPSAETLPSRLVNKYLVHYTESTGQNTMRNGRSWTDLQLTENFMIQKIDKHTNNFGSGQMWRKITTSGRMWATSQNACIIAKSVVTTDVKYDWPTSRLL